MAEAREIDLGLVKGPKGDKGDTGPRGPEGPEGPQGKAGVVDANSAILFTQAIERQNIDSGENFGTILGKIQKWFADLKTVAFTGSYNDLSSRPALKPVATSGSYNDLTNKPATLPANGGNAATVGGKSAETLQNYNNLTNKPKLGSAASQGVANNFTTNTAGYVADARTVKQLKDDLSKKIVSKSGNIAFKDGGNGESYGYITIPSGYEMLAVYMQEVSSNVKLRCKGFNKNAGTGGYTVWLDFAINSNVFMHWIYAKI